MREEHSEAAARGRYGYVSAYDPKRHMARVRFPDKDNMVSAWLPVAVPNSRKNKDEFHLDIDEHVYCNMLGNGLEAGVVLCSIWDDRNQPPKGNPDVRQVTFDDGTEVFYDREKHVLTIDLSHSGGHIQILGKVQIIGDVNVSGNIYASGTIIDAGGNTNHHAH